MARFDEAMALVLRHEGGYVHDPDDPGGETKYGISHRSYPTLSIADLTEADAIAIYKRDWWDTSPCFVEIPDDALAIKLFDLAVNIGLAHALRCLQRATNSLQVPTRPWWAPWRTATAPSLIAVDGRWGPQTLAAVTACSAPILLATFKAQAAMFYRSLNRPKYETGWIKRVYDG